MRIKIAEAGIDNEILKQRCEEMAQWHGLLMSDDKTHLGADFKGWVRLPETIDEKLVADIINTAEKIKEKCTLFIVVGIGGSFLGAQAVIDALNGSREGWPEIVFAGFNMNGAYINKLKKRIARESVCMCVISKSGRTVEPLLSYAVFKELIFGKYGYKEARKRIYVITDETKGDLRPEAFEKQFKSFNIPEDIGGRYSVLTAVGLLPIAVAGHDIRKLLDGARDMQFSDWSTGGELVSYGAVRTLLQEEGKFLELFEYFEGNLRYFGEWLKQLFGETGGKDGKGAYPACLFFSRDLHSIGQFLQQGRQMFFETMIRIDKRNDDVIIPWPAGYPYAGKTMEQINGCAEEGVIRAHIKAGIPVNEIHIDELNEFTLGQMIYFFEMSAALSAYVMGLNPFDQPGVEAYKTEMKRLIEDLKVSR